MFSVRVLIYTDSYADNCDFPIMSMLSVQGVGREGTQKYNTVNWKRGQGSNTQSRKMTLSGVICKVKMKVNLNVLSVSSFAILFWASSRHLHFRTAFLFRHGRFLLKVIGMGRCSIG
jgi:hypothetical protein